MCSETTDIVENHLFILRNKNQTKKDFRILQKQKCINFLSPIRNCKKVKWGWAALTLVNLYHLKCLRDGKKGLNLQFTVLCQANELWIWKVSMYNATNSMHRGNIKLVYTTPSSKFPWRSFFLLTYSWKFVSMLLLSKTRTACYE